MKWLEQGRFHAHSAISRCVVAGIDPVTVAGVSVSRLQSQADARTRTGDPFITSEVLYQLSYVGEAPTVAVSSASDARRA